MKEMYELSERELNNIFVLLRDIGYDTEKIGSILFDGFWKYCGSDQELKDAYKELYGTEFINDDDFNMYVRFCRGIILLESGEENKYLIYGPRK